VTNLLHQLGFTYKKPKLVPANADEQAQDEFIKFYLEYMKKSQLMSLYFLLMVSIRNIIVFQDMGGFAKEKTVN
jgi:hypothetical protein